MVAGIVLEFFIRNYAVIFTDALLKRGRGVKYFLAFTVRFKGQTIDEGCRAVELTASSMLKIS